MSPLWITINIDIWQCSKLLSVRLSETDNFRGGPGHLKKKFLQFHVYELKFKAGGLTTFFIEFWTLYMNHFQKQFLSWKVNKLT